MALSTRLQMRQSQSLVITPQLLQAIRLLQMSAVEVGAFVDAEIETNPLLSRREQEAAGDERPSAERGAAASDGRDAGFEDAVWGGPSAVTGAAEGSGVSAANLQGGRPGRRGQASPASGGEAFDPISRVAAGTSLVSHVEAQISARFAAVTDRCIARHLLAALDPGGYLTETVEGVAATLGVDGGEAERVLAACQDMEPTGIFARSLAECLALQLAERNRLDPAMRALLDQLPLLAERRLAELRLACGVDETDFSQMLAELRALDPKPGLRFDAPPVQTLVPDVIVRAGPNGWIVELNEETLPKVLVDRTYRVEIRARSQGDEVDRYLSECLQRASWLARSLDQRANTILRAATEIVRHQGEFLDHGVTGLKPLSLRVIAERIGVHESTVSRATANKYISTPRGIFELKFFFSSALADTAGGDAHAAEAVKHRIRKLIDCEAPDAVLSDDAIVAMLGGAGIAIARRTVAKYREMLGIPSSVQRRRDKRAAMRESPAA